MAEQQPLPEELTLEEARGLLEDALRVLEFHDSCRELEGSPMWPRPGIRACGIAFLQTADRIRQALRG